MRTVSPSHSNNAELRCARVSSVDTASTTCSIRPAGTRLQFEPQRRLVRARHRREVSRRQRRRDVLACLRRPRTTRSPSARRDGAVRERLHALRALAGMAAAPSEEPVVGGAEPVSDRYRSVAHAVTVSPFTVGARTRLRHRRLRVRGSAHVRQRGGERLAGMVSFIAPSRSRPHPSKSVIVQFPRVLVALAVAPRRDHRHRLPVVRRRPPPSSRAHPDGVSPRPHVRLVLGHEPRRTATTSAMSSACSGVSGRVDLVRHHVQPASSHRVDTQHRSPLRLLIPSHHLRPASLALVSGVSLFAARVSPGESAETRSRPAVARTRQDRRSWRRRRGP